MIEQTELVVIKWHYHTPVTSIATPEKISAYTDLDVMKKRAANKTAICNQRYLRN